MKYLYDIYEDGAITATPGNTTGMGNPLPPSEEPGTEPMCGKAKCKRKKKKVEESILKKTSKKIQDFNIIDSIAEWFVDAACIKSRRDAALEAFKKQIIPNGDGTIDIDTRKSDDNRHKLYLIVIPKEGIPEWISIRNIYLDKYDECLITTSNTNLRSVNWNVIGGDGKPGDVDITINSANDVYLGNLKCRLLRFIGTYVANLEFDQNIEFEELNITNMSRLEKMSNIPTCCKKVTLPELLVCEHLKNTGFIPKTTEIELP